MGLGIRACLSKKKEPLFGGYISHVSFATYVLEPYCSTLPFFKRRDMNAEGLRLAPGTFKGLGMFHA